MPASLRRLPIFAALALAAILSGCGPKLDQASYDKIQNGMTLREVERILGGRGEDETAAGMSIGSSGLTDNRKAAQNVFRWKKGTANIVVIFRDDKVISKTSEGL